VVSPLSFRGIGLRYRNQSAKTETFTGPMENRVGIVQGPGANRKEGCATAWLGVKRTGRDWLEETALFLGPRVLASGSPDIAWCDEEDRERSIRGKIGRNIMRVQREESLSRLSKYLCWSNGTHI
jgi:hypothetical protein